MNMNDHYVTIKLKNGTDLIGLFHYESDNKLEVKNPIEIKVDPVHGFYAKSWLLLAVSDTAYISKSDILFFDQASDKAISQYNDFMDHISKEEAISSMSDEDESILEDMFMSKIVTKH